MTKSRSNSTPKPDLGQWLADVRTQVSKFEEALREAVSNLLELLNQVPEEAQQQASEASEEQALEQELKQTLESLLEQLQQASGAEALADMLAKGSELMSTQLQNRLMATMGWLIHGNVSMSTLIQALPLLSEKELQLQLVLKAGLILRKRLLLQQLLEKAEEMQKELKPRAQESLLPSLAILALVGEVAASALKRSDYHEDTKISVPFGDNPQEQFEINITFATLRLVGETGWDILLMSLLLEEKSYEVTLRSSSQQSLQELRSLAEQVDPELAKQLITAFVERIS
ncbi:MAG: hypothetical protein ACOX2O_01465 [Bdellovibrionota bacterium]|jgi:hypothetical protein